MSIQDKKNIIKRIEKLDDPIEYGQLLKIIIENGVKYTETDQGSFVDLTNVSKDIIKKLDQIVTLCEKNRKYHETMKRLLEENKKQAEKLYEQKLSRKQQTNVKIIKKSDLQESDYEDISSDDYDLEDNDNENDGNGPDDSD